jgi:long-chain acyl-CoA synthetase
MATWAQHHDLAGAPYEEIVSSAAAREMVQQSIDELNRGLGRWETIKRFEVLDRDLSVEAGELTPSMKVRRREVERRYRDLLDTLYVDTP